MKRIQWGHIAIRFASLVLAGFLVAGCSTTATHVGAFGKAASEASANIEKALRAVDDTTVERKLSDIAISTNTPSITADTFKGLLDETQLQPRLAVLKQLESYSKALGELATADFRKDIDSASKDLYGALGGLTNTYNRVTGRSLQVSDSDWMIVATAVDGIGNAIVEAKRQHAIRQIVLKFNPVIQEVSRCLADELPKLYTDLVEKNLQSVGVDMASAYKREAKALTYQERLSALRLVGRAKQAPKAAPAMLAAAGKAAEKIGAAHASLKEAALRQKLTSKELVTNIKDLIAFGENVKEFYETLKK